MYTKRNLYNILERVRNKTN